MDGLPSGTFSYNSLRRELCSEIPDIPCWQSLQGIHVSVKVKSFTWLLLKGKVPMTDKLARLNLIGEQQNTCPLRSQPREDINHLFVHYSRINPLWYKAALMWDIATIHPNSVLGYYEYWFHTKLSIRKILAWCIAFFALIQSIRNARNDTNLLGSMTALKYLDST